jgi:hypothetical protein
MEKIDTGGQIGMMDPVTLQMLSQFQKTNTPDALLSANTTMRGQNLTDARSREAHAFTVQQADKPVWDADRGLAVNLRSGTAAPVTMNGQPLGQKNATLSDNQAKALLFGSRMAESNKVLSAMSDKGVDRPGNVRMVGDSIPGWLGGGVVSTVGNLTQSADQQQVEQAQRDFINAVLRRESGAAIAPSEFENARKQYFGEPFDSKEKRDQKARNRDLAIRGVLVEVPEAQRSSLTNAKSGPVSSGPAPGSVEGGYRFKGGNAADPKNWERM